MSPSSATSPASSSTKQISLLARSRLLVLLCAALLLLVVIALSLRFFWREPPAPILPDESALSVNGYQSYQTLAAAEIEISERPLFWQTRRPLAEEIAEEPEPEAPPKANRNIDQFQLLGLFTASDAASAIVQYKKEKHRLRVGDSLEGWTLVGVEGNSALFTGEGNGAPESKVLYEPVVLPQQWPGNNDLLQNQSDF